MAFILLMAWHFQQMKNFLRGLYMVAGVERIAINGDGSAEES